MFLMFSMFTILVLHANMLISSKHSVQLMEMTFVLQLFGHKLKYVTHSNVDLKMALLKLLNVFFKANSSFKLSITDQTLHQLAGGGRTLETVA